jgi:hypothetical protein
MTQCSGTSRGSMTRAGSINASRAESNSRMGKGEDSMSLGGAFTQPLQTLAIEHHHIAA